MIGTLFAAHHSNSRTKTASSNAPGSSPSPLGLFVRPSQTSSYPGEPLPNLTQQGKSLPAPALLLARSHRGVKLHADKALLHNGLFNDGKGCLCRWSAKLFMNRLSQRIERDEAVNMRHVLALLSRQTLHHRNLLRNRHAQFGRIEPFGEIDQSWGHENGSTMIHAVEVFDQFAPIAGKRDDPFDAPRNLSLRDVIRLTSKIIRIERRQFLAFGISGSSHRESLIGVVQHRTEAQIDRAIINQRKHLTPDESEARSPANNHQ